MAGDLTFVTGATGFVGSHVVRQLLKRGDRVRVLVRKGSPTRNIEGLDCEICAGDLKDAGSLARGIRDCRRVYHVAADYRLWARDTREIYDNNVNGTRNIFNACRDAGVERVIYTSTVGTIGTRPDGLPADEDTPVRLEDMIGHYKRSKFMAERAAFEFAQAGVPIVIVNPTTPIGAGDIKPTPTGKIIVNFLQGRMPAYVDTGLNLVAVEDVARGHLLAEQKGVIGRRYILGGENMSLKEILGALARISGRRAPKIALPWGVAFCAGAVNQFFAGTILGKEPSVPLEGVRMARHKMYVNCDRARRELSYNSSPAIEALREAVGYLGSKPGSVPTREAGPNMRAGMA